MKIAKKIALSLILAVLAGCAGSNPATKNDVQGKTLVKANTPVADSLFAKMPVFAQSVFKGMEDSVLGDFYYSVVDGRIDSLYNLKDGAYERNAGIRYVDSNRFFVGCWQIQAGEITASKVYQNENLIREYQKGKFYRIFNADSVLNIEGDVRLVNMDSDSITCIKCVSKYHPKNNEKNYTTLNADSYTGDAKKFKFVMNLKFDVKVNLDSVKQYNNQGVLIKDMLFPKYLRDYYDNGNLKHEWAGALYRNEKGLVNVENGTLKGYFENGQISLDAEYKNKKRTFEKQWNESGRLTREIVYDSLGEILTEKDWNDRGVLTKDMSYPEYFREFYDDGQKMLELTGLYRIAPGQVSVENGSLTRFYENGKTETVVNFKDRKGYSLKSWYEDGSLQAEGDASKGSHRLYHQNGKMMRDIIGKFYYDVNEGLVFTEGVQKEWSYQGKLVLEERLDSLGRIVFAKVWNDAGVLIIDTKMPRSMKTYWDDGKPKTVYNGKLGYGDDKQIVLDSGEYKSFYPNGRKENVATYKNRNPVVGKKWNSEGRLIMDCRYDETGTRIYEKLWNDKGVLVSDFDFPRSWKSYYDNGVLESERVGVLFFDSLGKVRVKEGTLKTFKEDGSWDTEGTIKNGVPSIARFRILLDNGDEAVLERGFDSLGVLNLKKYIVKGILRIEKSGVLSSDGDSVVTGSDKVYYDNGKLKTHIVYDQKKMVSKKEWNERESLVRDVHIPDYYREYYDDGKLMQEATGMIVEEDGSFKVKEGVIKVFDSSGKVSFSATYKDFQVVTKKNGEY